MNSLKSTNQKPTNALLGAAASSEMMIGFNALQQITLIDVF